MKKTDKIRLLAHSIVMLESSYTNKHREILELARQIAYLVDGNPNYCMILTLGQNPEDVHEAVKNALKYDIDYELGDYTPF